MSLASSLASANFPPFPELPDSPDGASWPGSVNMAYDTIRNSLRHARTLALQEDGADRTRVIVATSKLRQSTIPLLQMLVNELQNDDFKISAARALGAILAQLERNASVETEKFVLIHAFPIPIISNAFFREKIQVHHLEPVTLVHTGDRGPPQKVINEAWLAEATSPRHRLTITKIAEALSLDRKTVRSYMKEYGLERKFTPLTNEELETILRELKLTYPDAGVLTILGHLHARNMRVPRDRIWRTLQKIDALGVATRQAEATIRQEYNVPRCNHLWHFDGHHKLIDWGIVFHGGVDGYNNEVCLLLAQRLSFLIYHADCVTVSTDE
jgi:hypothetical protein